MRLQYVKVMPDRRVQRLMIHSRTENFQVGKESPSLLISPWDSQEAYNVVEGIFLNYAYFTEGFILLFWVTGRAWEAALLPVCLSLETWLR